MRKAPRQEGLRGKQKERKKNEKKHGKKANNRKARRSNKYCNQ
jgi:hypothetical protein